MGNSAYYIFKHFGKTNNYDKVGWLFLILLDKVVKEIGGTQGFKGSPDGISGKEPSCRCRRHKRLRFNPWVGKIPWRRSWQTHSSIFAWKIPWTEEPGGLKSISIWFSCSVMSDSLRPYGLLHARLPCPSPTPRACSNSRPPQFKSINSSALNFLYSPTLTSIHDYWKNHSFD